MCTHLWNLPRGEKKRAGLDQAAATSNGDRFQPAVNLEPVEDVLNVIARRRNADIELTGDGPGAESLPHQPQHLDLATGELH